MKNNYLYQNWKTIFISGMGTFVLLSIAIVFLYIKEQAFSPIILIGYIVPIYLVIYSYYVKFLIERVKRNGVRYTGLVTKMEQATSGCIKYWIIEIQTYYGDYWAYNGDFLYPVYKIGEYATFYVDDYIAVTEENRLKREKI